MLHVKFYPKILSNKGKTAFKNILKVLRNLEKPRISSRFIIPREFPHSRVDLIQLSAVQSGMKKTEISV